MFGISLRMALFGLMVFGMVAYAVFGDGGVQLHQADPESVATIEALVESVKSPSAP